MTVVVIYQINAGFNDFVKSLNFYEENKKCFRIFVVFWWSEVTKCIAFFQWKWKGRLIIHITADTRRRNEPGINKPRYCRNTPVISWFHHITCKVIVGQMCIQNTLFSWDRDPNLISTVTHPSNKTEATWCFCNISSYMILSYVINSNQQDIMWSSDVLILETFSRDSKLALCSVNSISL